MRCKGFRLEHLLIKYSSSSPNLFQAVRWTGLGKDVKLLQSAYLILIVSFFRISVSCDFYTSFGNVYAAPKEIYSDGKYRESIPGKRRCRKTLKEYLNGFYSLTGICDFWWSWIYARWATFLFSAQPSLSKWKTLLLLTTVCKSCTGGTIFKTINR